MTIDVLNRLKQAILSYEPELSLAAAKEALESNTDPIAILDVMTRAMREVGDGYGRGDGSPDLLGAAAAMKSAMPVVEEELKKTKTQRPVRGIVVIGTVRGDIHDIGKVMVATLLTADGFAVYDLGVNLPPDKFVEGVRTHNADILAMSALLTTTAPEMQKVIETLRSEGLRNKVRVMVGGAAVTRQFAQDIGADGYDSYGPWGSDAG